MVSILRPNEKEQHGAINKNAGATDDGGADNTVKQELRYIEKKQLLVKSKCQNHNPGAFSSADESSGRAPRDNIPQKHPPDDNSQKSFSNDSSPPNRESCVKAQVSQTSQSQYLATKSPPALKETSPYIKSGTTTWNEKLIAPDARPSAPDFIKQDPVTLEFLGNTHEENLQMSNCDVKKGGNIMHIPDNTKALGHLFDHTAPEVSEIGSKANERKDGAREETGLDEILHAGKTVEDLMSTDLEEIWDQFNNLESSSTIKNGEDLEGASLQQDSSMDDTHDGHVETPAALDLLEEDSYPGEARSSGDDRLSGKSESDDSEGQNLEDDDEEEEARKEDEMPLRNLMRNRAHSQALKSALNNAEVWGEKIQQLEENLKRMKAAAESQPRLQSSILPLGSTGGELLEGPMPLGSHRLPGVYHANDPSIATNVEIQQQNNLAQQRHEYQQRVQAVHRQRQPPTDFHRGPPKLPNLGQMSEMNYSGDPRGGYPYGSLPQQDTSFQHISYPSAPFGQMLPGYSATPYPPSAYDFSRRNSMSFAPNHWSSTRQDASKYHTNEYGFVDEEEEQPLDTVSDDDEPLKERVKRHPSILSHSSGISSSSPPKASEKLHQHHDQGDSSEIKFLASTPKPKSSQMRNPVRMQRPLPRPTLATEPEETATSPSSGSGIGSWKLPVFEVQRQPKENEEDGPLVKVSIPNLVREELLLSPDHAEQEVHLLLNIFVPGQQALITPDPEPAVAVLNFHTIALMVVEAFVQFEIGDVLGRGHGHWHENNNHGDVENERSRDAKDANVDDVFFAVIDRWRAGLESKKKNLELIRGVQEFCDVALDVIYYIKEHGLLSNEPDSKPRTEGGDKGKKRGPRKGQEEDSTEEEIGKSKGRKRAAAQDVNVVTARKKVKTEKKAPASKAKSKAKPKAKPKSRLRSTPGITVIVK